MVEIIHITQSIKKPNTKILNEISNRDATYKESIMAKKIQARPPIEEIRKVIDNYGLRGTKDRVIDLLNVTDAEFFSFAFTKAGDAAVIVIAKEKYNDEI